jgi:putative flippase GtrA
VYLNFKSIIKKKKIFQYLTIGIINSIFAYFSGIYFFYSYYENLGALFVTILASIINIFFSFCNYKFFFFKTKKNYFLNEYLKINFFQFFLILLNSLMLWVLIEKININIYFTQFILIVINIIISTIINFKFVFKNK